MYPINRFKHFLPAILLGLALIVSLSCLPTGLFSNRTPTTSVRPPTDTLAAPTYTPQPTSTKTPSADTPQPTPTSTKSAEESLNAVGPWLLIETAQGLWAANPDGSGLQQLTDINYWQGNLKQAIQPAGNHIVILTPGNYDFHHMALNLLSLPDGQMTKITDLTSPAAEASANASPGDPGFEALRAIGERPSYAWSPDGSVLAFSGVMDGPSADIYLYNLQTGSITRVSQDPAQDFAPSWSPDGTHLLFLAVDGFGTGAGWSMSGVWAANPTGGSLTQLFPSDSAGEEIIGWLDNTTVLMATWDQPCGLQKLRLFDLETNQPSMLYADCFNSAAADGFLGAALYSSFDGVFKLTAEDPTPIMVDFGGDAFIDRRYPGDRLFTVRFTSGSIATFGSNGGYDHQISPVQVSSGDLDVAEYGVIWGWTSQNEEHPGTWITGPGVEIGQIYDGPSILPIWSQDNNLIFFAIQDDGYELYQITFDSYYTDLHRVNLLEIQPVCVAWLGWY